MKKMLRHVFQWMIIGLAGTVFAQSDPAVDSLFFRGVQFYEQESFTEALETFEFLDRVYTTHHRKTGSLLMQGKALYKSGEYQRAEEAFQELIADYPKSSYYDDALYGLAQVYYQKNKLISSAQKFLEILDIEADPQITRKSVAHSSDIMDYHLDLEDMRNLLNLVHGESGRSAVVIKLAEQEMEAKHYRAAQTVLNDYMDQYPSSANLFQVQQMLTRVENLGKESITIGVILPISSGNLSELGKQVLAGIYYAAEKHNATQSTRVDLVIKDSGGRVLKAILAAQQLCRDEKVTAIIGELESDITSAIAAVAQEHEVVLIAPTAYESGITDIGEYIFQLTCNVSLRAMALADYAVSDLDMHRFAVLFPADSYGQTMRNAFVQRVKTLGAEIMVEKYYFGQSGDLKTQFEAIRAAGIDSMIADSVLQIIPKEILEDEEFEPQAGVTYVTQPVEELVDSVQLAVKSIDGLFLPVYYDDLRKVIAQFASLNLGAKIFGGSPWNDEEFWKEQSRLIDMSMLDGTVFVSDFYVSPYDVQYKEFQNNFRKKMKRSPTKLSVFGHDALKLIAQNMPAGLPTSSGLRDNLAALQNFPGLQGDISFNAQRVNPRVFLLQYKAGMISLIK